MSRIRRKWPLFIALLASGLWARPLLASPITLLSYDPAATYSGHGWNQEPLASRMTMPASPGVPWKLETFEIFISYTASDPTPIEVSLWADLSGEPGTLLYSQPESDVDVGWNAFSLLGSGLGLDAGDSIFVGYTTSYGGEIGPRWSQSPAVGVSYRSNPNYPEYQSDPWRYFTLGEPADWTIQLKVTPVPEPSTFLLFAAAAISIYVRRRKALD